MVKKQTTTANHKIYAIAKIESKRMCNKNKENEAELPLLAIEEHQVQYLFTGLLPIHVLRTNVTTTVLAPLTTLTPTLLSHALFPPPSFLLVAFQRCSFPFLTPLFCVPGICWDKLNE
jgi:hypothetical protein